MSRVLELAAIVCASLFACLPSAASSMVTGNGFGFAVVSPQGGTLTKFYAHPYSFARPDVQNPLSEGVETANFIKALGWNDRSAPSTSAEYVEDSQVIRVRNVAGEGLFFMPFGFEQAALVINWEPGSKHARRGYFSVEWSHPVRSHEVIRELGAELHLLKFAGIQESLLLIPLDGKRARRTRPEQYLSTSLAWALVSVESDAELEPTIQKFTRWRSGLVPSVLAKREIAEVESWRVKPAVQFATEKERHLWRQSEIILRMAQVRESNRPGRNNNGLILASLPDGVWFMPWVRDMAYASVALARMGHRDEARAALLAYFNAQPTGKMRQQTTGVDYQISVVRYFGDGSEEPFFTNEGSTNIEFDNWGLVLWFLGEYLHDYDDPALLSLPTYRGPLYESAKAFVVKPLLANLEPYGPGLIVAAYTSIWEERQKDKKHFAFSTAAAIVGLRSFAEVARRAGDEPARTDVLKHVSLLEKGFTTAFIRDGKLRGTLEETTKNDIDGALLAVINFGIVTDPAIVRDTLERMELLKVASGGYRRVRSVLTDPSIFEYWYERQEFLFVDFSLAEIYRRREKKDKADAILKRIVAKAAADHNFIPEMYVAENCRLFPGKLGAPTGAIPMVGYGAGTYVLSFLAGR
ncbi:MAG: glycoside hydrolase family 15 protein [Terriglobales bacterium]